MLEWATAYAWLAAGVLFARAAWKDKGAARLVCLLLALAAFFAAGEELSWGQRLFGFEPPELFLEENFQQELNLHNLFDEEYFHPGIRQADGMRLAARHPQPERAVFLRVSVDF